MIIFNKGHLMQDFYQAVQRHLEKKSAKLSRYTYDTYHWHLHKLRLYRESIDCKNVTEAFIRGYIEFMRARRNQESTINRSLSILRMFINMAIKEKSMRTNPMKDTVIRKHEGLRHFLEIEELQFLYRRFLESSAQLTYSERESLRAFLFSCFTGLRYADLKTLTWEDIQNGKIRKRTQKTGSLIYIPIPSQAQKLMQTKNGSLVLHVVNNSSFNKNLRSAAQRLGYKKRLHTHLARHTFATACISLGIPVEVVSRMLGHSNLQTTLIYANYASSVIDREMKKFQL